MTRDHTQDFLTIPLSKGCFAKLSREDKDLTEKLDPKNPMRMKPVKYSAVSNGKKDFAVRSEPGNNKKKVYLAREIMERILERPLIPGEIVSLIDHSAPHGVLDYTRANLKLKITNTHKKL